ncbi:MAG: hypothetical protein ABIT36_10660 [Steroidobacteraceae bacterium]
MWKSLRILLLSSLLAGVAATAWLERSRSTSWQDMLWVGVFPVNGYGSATAAQFVDTLRENDCHAVQECIAREAQANGVQLAGRLVLMAGHRVISVTDAQMPASLRDVSIRARSARQINWTRP